MCCKWVSNGIFKEGSKFFDQPVQSIWGYSTNKKQNNDISKIQTKRIGLKIKK